jgi:hypothetical protein
MFRTQHHQAKAAQLGLGVASNETRPADTSDNTFDALTDGPIDTTILGDAEERMLRCLGAAVIMQWNTLPTKLQRELFDNAGSMGDLSPAMELRGQLARFLHNHKNDQ